MTKALSDIPPLPARRVPVVERALNIATRMVGTEKSRGYCLELVCADFLAGRGEESSPEEILMVIHRLVRLLPREYQEGIAAAGEGNWRPQKNAEESETDQTGEADLPAADEAGARARRMALSKVRIARKPAGPPQDQAEPNGQRLAG